MKDRYYRDINIGDVVIFSQHVERASSQLLFGVVVKISPIALTIVLPDDLLGFSDGLTKRTVQISKIVPIEERVLLMDVDSFPKQFKKRVKFIKRLYRI